jgi:hypothetical protein
MKGDLAPMLNPYRSSLPASPPKLPSKKMRRLLARHASLEKGRGELHRMVLGLSMMLAGILSATGVATAGVIAIPLGLLVFGMAFNEIQLRDESDTLRLAIADAMGEDEGEES